MMENQYKDLSKIKKSYQINRGKFALNYSHNGDKIIPHLISSYYRLKRMKN